MGGRVTTIKYHEELPQVSQKETASLDSKLTSDKLNQGLMVTPVTFTNSSCTLLDLFTLYSRMGFLPVSG